MKPGKVLLFSLGGLVLAQAIAYVQREASPLLAAVLTFVGGAIPFVIDYFTTPPPPDPERPRDPHDPRPDPPRRTAAAFVAGLLVLALLGGAAYGVSYAVGVVTGWEPNAVQRLKKPVTGQAGALSVRIEEVKIGSRFTQVRLTATNKADFPVTVPLFDNCQIVAPKKATLAAKTGFTTSSLEVPPGAVPITKDIVFSGTPSASATSITLACNRLFWQGFGQPASLQVKKIALHAR